MKIKLIEKANPSDRKSVKLYARAPSTRAETAKKFRTESIKPKIIFTPGTELKAEMEKITYKIES